jgi:hypothetical protein
MKKFVFLFILMLGYTSASLTDDLKFYYKFDTPTPVDEVWGYTPSIFGANYIASGQMNGAYSFDGSGDYLDLGSTFNNPSGTAYSFWVNPSSTSWLRLFNSPAIGDRGLYLQGTRVAGYLVDCAFMTAYGVVPIGEWTHIVLTNDGSTSSLYINGEFILSDSCNFLEPYGVKYISLDNGGEHFYGAIDEFGLWYRGLSGFEVSQLYNSGLGFSHPFCSPSYVNTSWINTANSSCLVNDTLNSTWELVQYDENFCEASSNTTFSKINQTGCDFCSYNIANSSLSSWIKGACQPNNSLSSWRTLTMYDSNYSTCYGVTGLDSDLWNDGENKTFTEPGDDAFCFFSIDEKHLASLINGGSGSLSALVSLNNLLFLFCGLFAIFFILDSINKKRFLFR